MKGTLRTASIRIALVFGLYFVLRAVFALYNYKMFANSVPTELLNAFLLGMRYDISTILQVNAVFVLLWLLPVKPIHYGPLSRILNGLFLFINCVCILLNLADAELIHFSGQRLTLNYFAIQKDVENQTVQLLLNYWKMSLVAAACILGFVWSYLKIEPKLEPFKRPLRSLALVPIVLFVLIIGVRGGAQRKPLRMAQAYQFSQLELGHLALNSTFTVLQSGLKPAQTKVKYFDEGSIKSFVERQHNLHFRNLLKQPQNVVLIIMESFAHEYVSAFNGADGFTPFFDSLAERGLLFSNSFANGRRSLEAVPSILAGVPSLLNNAFLTSMHQSSRILGLGEVLGNHNYVSAFFHGAPNGSMFFDSFAIRSGIQKYYGMSEYPEPKRDYDGFWGIFDEPFFAFSAETINNQLAQSAEAKQRPFFATIFSLSSHQPYTIPEQHRGKFRKGPLEIHESIQYADYALQTLFDKFSKMPWYKDTLFVITADHTQKSILAKYQDTLGLYRVPILLFHPQLTEKSKWPKHDEFRVVQHADLLPTILDILSVAEPRLVHTGSSIFSTEDKGFVINRTPSFYWYLSEKYYIEMDFQDSVRVFTHARTYNLVPLAQEKWTDEVTSEIDKFKAHIQYFINGVVENTLVPPARPN